MKVDQKPIIDIVIDSQSEELMMFQLQEVIEDNLNHNKPQIEDDQFIEILEVSKEFQKLNEDLAHKTTIRDLIKNKIARQKPEEQFEHIDQQMENAFTKLATVLFQSIGSTNFYNELKRLNDVTYTQNKL